jgi:hypothetical protein
MWDNIRMGHQSALKCAKVCHYLWCAEQVGEIQHGRQQLLSHRAAEVLPHRQMPLAPMTSATPFLASFPKTQVNPRSAQRARILRAFSSFMNDAEIFFMSLRV